MEFLSYRLHIEGLTIDKISKTINMPEDFVRESINIKRINAG
jgi:hypothetical protein